MMWYFISIHDDRRAFASTNDQNFVSTLEEAGFYQVSLWTYWIYRLVPSRHWPTVRYYLGPWRE